MAGVLAGLLGIGGGLIIVPALLFIFDAFKVVPENVIAHTAVGTSLAAMVAASLAAAYSHHLKGAVRWNIVALLTPGVMLGAYGGSQAAHAMPGSLLKT